MGTAYLPLVSLSTSLHPQKEALMAVLKGWFDESGNSHPDMNVSSFAGYISSVDTWNQFEPLWQKVLDDFEVPYFHGREFGPSIGPFAKWKGKEHEPTRIAFIQRLTKAVSDSGTDIVGVAGAVFLGDLDHFNKTHKQAIEPYSFCMSACLMELFNRIWKTEDRVEAVCGTIDRGHLRIDKAFGYLSHDPFYSQCEKFITMIPLCKGIEDLNVLQLQFADFAAWEVRQFNERRSDWLKDTPNEDEQTFFNWFKWVHATSKTPIHFSGERQSAISLVRAAPLQGRTWTYNAIVDLDDKRGHIWTR
jgi:hypothetical protein